MLTGTRKADHIAPILHQICFSMRSFKMVFMIYNALYGWEPEYLKTEVASSPLCSCTALKISWERPSRDSIQWWDSKVLSTSSPSCGSVVLQTLKPRWLSKVSSPQPPAPKEETENFSHFQKRRVRKQEGISTTREQRQPIWNCKGIHFQAFLRQNS